MKLILRLFLLGAMWSTLCALCRGNPLTLTAGEYFFDTDPGVRLATPLPMTADSHVIIFTDISGAGLDPGLHTFYVRFLDSRGIWSQARGRAFRVGPASLLSDAEYFLDSDPGEGQGLAIDVRDSLEHILFADLPLPPTSTGLHTFFLRYRTTNGFWSQARGKALRVRAPTGDIVADGEAFIDTDPGIGQGVFLRAEDGAFDEADETMYRNIRCDTLSLGQHYVYVRVRSGDVWSYALRDSFVVNGPEAFRLMAFRLDSASSPVRLVWADIGATEYHVHYDSVSTGPFTNFYTVAAPDTSLVLATTPGAGKRFYYVTAYWPDTVKKSKELPNER